MLDPSLVSLHKKLKKRRKKRFKKGPARNLFREGMEIFDQFPRELRDAINYQNRGMDYQSLRTVKFVLDSKGLSFVLSIIKEQDK